MIKQFWQAFLKATALPNTTTYLESFHFELTEKWANELLRLVLIGKKKATASSLWFYQKNNERIPQVGDYSIVTDWNNIPHCVIKTTKITILAFKDITFDLCKKEGEDDNLESWQKGHIKFFTNEGIKEGYQFTWDMPVLFEEFKVVYKKDTIYNKEEA